MHKKDLSTQNPKLDKTRVKMVVGLVVQAAGKVLVFFVAGCHTYTVTNAPPTPKTTKKDSSCAQLLSN